MEAVAPGIGAQLAPAESHLSHSYSYPVGFSVHEPVLAVSVCPTAAVPEIDGGVAFDGGISGGGLDTTAVCEELAGVEGPAPFDAVTATRSVLPASAEATV